jgi:hypothetical protein
MSVAPRIDKMTGMFTVDEPTAEAIRRAFEDGGELAGVIELRRHFALIADNANARRCVQTSPGGRPLLIRPGIRVRGERTGPGRPEQRIGVP